MVYNAAKLCMAKSKDRIINNVIKQAHISKKKKNK